MPHIKHKFIIISLLKIFQRIPVAFKRESILSESYSAFMWPTLVYSNLLTSPCKTSQKGSIFSFAYRFLDILDLHHISLCFSRILLSYLPCYICYLFPLILYTFTPKFPQNAFGGLSRLREITVFVSLQISDGHCSLTCVTSFCWLVHSINQIKHNWR